MTGEVMPINRRGVVVSSFLKRSVSQLGFSWLVSSSYGWLMVSVNQSVLENWWLTTLCFFLAKLVEAVNG